MLLTFPGTFLPIGFSNINISSQPKVRNFTNLALCQQNIASSQISVNHLKQLCINSCKWLSVGPSSLQDMSFPWIFAMHSQEYPSVWWREHLPPSWYQNQNQKKDLMKRFWKIFLIESCILHSIICSSWDSPWVPHALQTPWWGRLVPAYQYKLLAAW